MPINTFIFDLDGTLVDSAEDITRALNYALKPHGLEGVAVVDTIRMIGGGITNLITGLLENSGRAAVERAISDFVSFYSKHIADTSRPYPHVIETIERLEGFRLAVVSNKRSDLSEKLLKQLGLIHHFKLVVGSDTVKEKKPSPAPIRYVLTRFGVKPDEAVIVGDSSYDIEAGHAAGVCAIALSSGYRPKETLLEADFILDSIKDLIPLVYDRLQSYDRRRQKRYPTPFELPKHLEFSINAPEPVKGIEIMDFSLTGLKLKSPVRFENGQPLKCTANLKENFDKRVSFDAIVRYCACVDSASCYIGAEITNVSDPAWFNVLHSIYEKSLSNQ